MLGLPTRKLVSTDPVRPLHERVETHHRNSPTVHVRSHRVRSGLFPNRQTSGRPVGLLLILSFAAAAPTGRPGSMWTFWGSRLDRGAILGAEPRSPRRTQVGAPSRAHRGSTAAGGPQWRESTATGHRCSVFHSPFPPGLEPSRSGLVRNP